MKLAPLVVFPSPRLLSTLSLWRLPWPKLNLLHAKTKQPNETTNQKAKPAPYESR